MGTRERQEQAEQERERLEQDQQETEQQRPVSMQFDGEDGAISNPVIINK